MIHASILAHFDNERELVLETDASGESLGAVLHQIAKDGRYHVVAYASRSLLKAEKNYSVSEQEIVAVVRAVEKFDTYVSGPKIFEVITDHNALCGLFKMKNVKGDQLDGVFRAYGHIVWRFATKRVL